MVGLKNSEKFAFLVEIIKALDKPTEKYKFASTDLKMLPVGFIVYWVVKGFGFGTLTMQIVGGKIVIDTECMSPEFVAALLREVKEPLLKKLEIL